jgi:hypothetical protein
MGSWRPGIYHLHFEWPACSAAGSDASSIVKADDLLPPADSAAPPPTAHPVVVVVSAPCLSPPFLLVVFQLARCLPLLLLFRTLTSRSMERYEPVREIGAGNFGVAKLMRNKETRELVAMKFIERGNRVRACFCVDIDPI